MPEVPDEPAHLGHAGGVHAVGRLVEDQELGVLEQRAGDPEPLLHPERVRPESVGAPRGEVDLFQDSLDPRLRSAGVAGEDA